MTDALSEVWTGDVISPVSYWVCMKQGRQITREREKKGRSFGCSFDNLSLSLQAFPKGQDEDNLKGRFNFSRAAFYFLPPARVNTASQ